MGLNRISKPGYGHLFLREENRTFDNILNIVIRNQHFQYLVHGNMKGVKRVEHCFSSIKCVDGLKFHFKSRDIPLSIPIGRNPRCCLFDSFLLNGELYQVCETWLNTKNWCYVT
jgi:hypothetical protein